MKSAELVKAISVLPILDEREDLLDLKLMDRIGHSRIGPRRHARLRDAAVAARSHDCSEPCRSNLLCRNHPRRPHHVQHARGKAEQQKHDQPPGRNSQATDRSASRYPLPAARPRPVRSTTENPGRSPTDRWSVVDPGPLSEWTARSEHDRAVRRDAATAQRAQPRRAEVFHDSPFRVRRRAMLSTPATVLAAVPPPQGRAEHTQRVGSSQELRLQA